VFCCIFVYQVIYHNPGGRFFGRNTDNTQPLLMPPYPGKWLPVTLSITGQFHPAVALHTIVGQVHNVAPMLRAAFFDCGPAGRRQIHNRYFHSR
jgi:hypothetical protein